MKTRARLSEWQMVIIMILITIIGVRATAPLRLASHECAPPNLSAKFRISPR
jgi:hypothetical protein